MAAATYNISIEQGTSFSIQFKYLNAADLLPINLSNHCVTLRILPKPDDETQTLSVITYTTVAQTVTPYYSFSINPDQGIITLQLSAEMTNSYLQPGSPSPITWTQAKYELEIITPDPFFQGSMRTVRRLLQGDINITQRIVPALTIPGCAASTGGDSVSSITDEQVSFSVLDSCIGSPCEFIGGNANIYVLTNPDPNFAGETSLILKDLDSIDNPYGRSYPGYVSVNITESKTIERIDVLIDRMSHSFAQDVRLLLTHNNVGTLLISNNKFNFNNNPKSLSFILSDYTPLRENVSDPEPTVSNVNHYFSSLLTNKNLGAARPKPITKDLFPDEAFDQGDSARNLTQYSTNLSVFENTNCSGEWRLYGLDTDHKNSGSIGAVKLIIYFKNEQSNDQTNSMHCGGVTRSADISGTNVTMSGNRTAEFSTNDWVVINYHTAFSQAVTVRKITTTPSYDTNDDVTTFSIDHTIDDMTSDHSITISRYNPESPV